jgi:deoxyribonuclease V
MGLAAHLGMIMDVPSIGCARENLYGEHLTPENFKGAYSEISYGEEIIGACLRTQKNIKPVFVSQGYKIELDTAIRIVMLCTTRYKMPEPLRAAHMAAGEARNKWPGNKVS